VYSSNIFGINGLNIMITLINVYFEYIKILCKIFTKYIVPMLQVYPNHIIIFIKITTNDNYYYIILYYIFILITCNEKIKLSFIIIFR